MTTRPRSRTVAAAVCGIEALVLAGFSVFYLVQLVTGQSPDVARVVTETVLIVLAALGTAALARLWLGGSGWPSTPTLVWHALLVPVAWAMFQSGQLIVGLLLSLAVVVAAGATLAAGPGSEFARPGGD